MLDVIETDPPRLDEVEDSGPVRGLRIAANWAEQRLVRETTRFLHAHGVGTSRAVRVRKTCVTNAVATITVSPCRLSRDICGIAFEAADQLVIKLGILKDALMRVLAGASHVRAEALDDVHCGLPGATSSALAPSCSRARRSF